MHAISLNEGYTLTATPRNNKVRLVVAKNGEEYVCRMETPRKLQQFAAGAGAHIFKGRLQLYKEAGVISVIVKGEVAGVVDEKNFTKYLGALLNENATG